METREPSSVDAAAKQSAAENSLPEAQAANEVQAQVSEQAQTDDLATIDTPEGNIDPEAAAEAEITEALDEEAVEETRAAVVASKMTKEQIIAAAKEIAAKEASEITRDEVNRIRQQYAAISKNEIEELRNKFIEEGGDITEFVLPEINDDEFHAVIGEIKEKKASWLAEQEAKHAANLERKNAIIAEIIALAEDTDNVNRTFPRYRELQDEFNAIGQVPAPEETSVWKRFQDARERYSDNLKINKELRDYDFKKNLDSKLLLVDEAVALDEEPDVITAFKRLQDLHAKWREIGPVAKEMREEIWNRFKDASAAVNKKYQAHFEERKARETENEQGKSAICERVEAYDFSSLKSYAAWEEMTKRIIEAQQEWKKFGFASKKMNNILFARFRQVCDDFFAKKAEYFRRIREEFAANLAAKNALVERAEALKDSTEWRKATEEFVAMQKEWKTIGPVAKKHSDAVWQRFQSACDYFFEQKKKSTSDSRRIEHENLKAKRDIIAQVEAIDEGADPAEARAKLAELQQKWQEIGHVPFRDKDKVYEAYRAAVNAVRAKFNLRESRANMERYNERVEQLGGDENALYREREKLMRVLEAKRNEARTYENNIGFLNTKSKTGESMIRDYQHKLERIKADIAQIEEKVKLLDSKI